MGNIENFDGIKIYINGREHLPPHFHCYYAEFHALIEISNLNIIAGKMPKRQLNKIINWAKDKQTELKDIFVELNPKFKI